MRYIQIFAALTATLATAVPVDSTPNLHKRDGPHVRMCYDVGMKGRCQTLAFNRGLCMVLGNGFNDIITSLKPDKGSTCELFDNTDCTGDSVPNVVHPGTHNLEDFGFNDRTSSYRCY